MMLLFAAVSIATNQPAIAPPIAAVVQATATVQIVSGVRLKLDSASNAGAPQAHDTTVAAEGVRRRARLIEFE